MWRMPAVLSSSKPRVLNATSVKLFLSRKTTVPTVSPHPASLIMTTAREPRAGALPSSRTWAECSLGLGLHRKQWPWHGEDVQVMGQPQALRQALPRGGPTTPPTPPHVCSILIESFSTAFCCAAGDHRGACRRQARSTATPLAPGAAEWPPAAHNQGRAAAALAELGHSASEAGSGPGWA